MVVYLAYHFESRELTRERMIKLMDVYFYFSEKFSDCAEEWITFEWLKKFGMSQEEIDGLKIKSLIEQATYFHRPFLVRNHPLLDISFCYKGRESKKYQNNFTGILIDANHSGSEGLVDLIGFKPEMDGFIGSRGMEHVNMSKMKI